MSEASDTDTSASDRGGADGDYIAFNFDDELAADAPETSGGGKRKRARTTDDSVREHAVARSTPWTADIDWHKCRNCAEM